MTKIEICVVINLIFCSFTSIILFRMAKAYLLLGGNLGNRFKTLNRATKLIETVVGEIVQKTSFFDCAPWGFSHKNSFLNRIIVVDTSLNANQLLLNLNRIENMLGRVRGSDQYIERNIDIDIIYFDDKIINDAILTIPHSKMHLRRFVLQPLCEIAPNFVHPIFQKTNLELLAECKDELSATIIAEPENSDNEDMEDFL